VRNDVVIGRRLQEELRAEMFVDAEVQGVALRVARGRSQGVGRGGGDVNGRRCAVRVSPGRGSSCSAPLLARSWRMSAPPTVHRT
jgi:hypothetical protein